MADPSTGAIHAPGYLPARYNQVLNPIQPWLMTFRKINGTARPIDFLNIDVALIVPCPYR
jgi:hypothetical protein